MDIFSRLQNTTGADVQHSERSIAYFNKLQGTIKDISFMKTQVGYIAGKAETVSVNFSCHGSLTEKILAL